jgi:uncharacterized membrane protein
MTAISGKAERAGGIWHAIGHAILSIVNGLGYFWRKITKFLRRYSRVFLTLIAGLLAGFAIETQVRWFADDSISTILRGWAFIVTLVAVGVSIGIVLYSVFRRRKHEKRYREYMNMLSKVNEERDKRYKNFR